MKKTATFLAAALMMMSSSAFAGECMIKIKRDACPGKEVTAYKPYDNKVETEEKKAFDSEGECKKWAVEKAKIIRRGTLTKKTVTASFDGKAAGVEEFSLPCK